MQIRDIRIGDILNFGGYDWFKADAEDTFISVNGIGNYPLGYSIYNAEIGYSYVDVLSGWLNSQEERFSVDGYERVDTYCVRQFVCPGFLYGFEPEEQSALIEAVRLPTADDVHNEGTRLPLFNKMGIRLKNIRYGGYMPYWLALPQDGRATNCIDRAGRVTRFYGSGSLLATRPIIRVNPEAVVAPHVDTITPFSQRPKRTYEIDFSFGLVDTLNTYTDEDFASLFALA